MECNPSDLTSGAYAINTVYSFCITFLELVIFWIINWLFKAAL